MRWLGLFALSVSKEVVIMREKGVMKTATTLFIAVLMLAGCASAPRRPAPSEGVIFQHPVQKVREAAVEALDVLGFEIKKQEPFYIQGFRPRKGGFIVVPGGDSVGIWLESQAQDRTRVLVTTAKTFVGIAGLKRWQRKVVAGMRTVFGKEVVGPFCEQYLTALERGDCEAVAQMLFIGREPQQSLTGARKSIAMDQVFRKWLGECRERRITKVNISSDQGPTVATVEYEAQFENGECDIILTLEKQDEQWMVKAVNYMSADLLRLTKPSEFQKDLQKAMQEMDESDNTMP